MSRAMLAAIIGSLSAKETNRMQQGWGPGQGGQGYGPPPQGYGPPPKKGMSAGMVILIILGTLFVLGGGSCVLCMAVGAGAAANAGNHSRPGAGAGPAAAVPNEAATPVTIGAILTAYKGNEIAADNTYKDKYVQISGGLVDDIKKDLFDKPYVTIGTGAAFEIPQVQCSLAADQGGKAATLQKGQRVTVRGRVHGLMLHVQLRDCEVL